ncbi:MAG: L-histidine N(alpha)-methyltransferase [Deltaproteobacteria bacterium]|nr:L-histidine N(alpha)-methyltransferase [Deltaproteobacteria bacterium]
MQLHHSAPLDLHASFAQDVAIGLAKTPKQIPPKYFYDQAGSLLFEEITRLDAYYLTRLERVILAQGLRDILALVPARVAVVEFGSGSADKTRAVLAALMARQGRLDYIPIDISSSAVAQYGQTLLAEFPDLHIQGMISDYPQAIQRLGGAAESPRLFLFLGSSLGNFTPEESVEFLGNVRAVMGKEDRFLLGADMAKDPAVLNAAYDDPQGVTARFNVNLLARINRELAGGFELSRFAHRAWYLPEHHRVEMHLESLEDQIVPVGARGISFRKGETIHTENSYKYTPPLLTTIVQQSGLVPLGQWSDERGWFTLNMLGPA